MSKNNTKEFLLKIKSHLEGEEAKKEAKVLQKDLTKILSDVKASSSDTSQFKELEDFIRMLESHMDALVAEHGNDFKEIFSGLDAGFVKQMQELFQVTKNELTAVDQLRKKIANVQTSGATQDEANAIKAEVEALYATLGRSGEINIADDLSPKQMVGESLRYLNNFIVVWDDVVEKVSRGFGFGGPSLSKEIQEEVDKLTATKKQLQQTLDEVSGKKKTKVELPKGDEEQLDFLKKLVANYKEAEEARKSFETRNDTSSDGYKQAVAEQIAAAKRLKSAFDDDFNLGDDAMKYTVKHLEEYDDAEQAIAKFNKDKDVMLSQIESLYAQKMQGIEADIQKLMSGSASKQAKENEKLAISYDHLDQAIQKYAVLQQQVNDGMETNEYGEDIESLIREFDELFMSLSKTKEESKEVSRILGDLSFGDIDTEQALEQLKPLLNIGEKSNFNTATAGFKTIAGAAERTKDAVGGLDDVTTDTLKQDLEQIHKLAFQTDKELSFSVTADGVKYVVESMEGMVKVSEEAAAAVHSVNSNMSILAHSHPGGKGLFSVADLYGGLNLKSSGANSPIMALSKTVASVLNLDGVTDDVINKVRAKLDSLPKGQVMNQQIFTEIQDIFKDNGFEGALQQFNIKNGPDELVSYLQAITVHAQEAQTPLEKLQGLISYYSNGKIDAGNMSQFSEYWDEFERGAKTAVETFDAVMKKIDARDKEGNLMQVGTADYQPLAVAAKNIAVGDNQGGLDIKVADDAVERAEKKLREFFDLANEAQTLKVDTPDDELGEYRGKLQLIRDELDELAEQGLITEESLKQVWTIYGNIERDIDARVKSSKDERDFLSEHADSVVEENSELRQEISVFIEKENELRTENALLRDQISKQQDVQNKANTNTILEEANAYEKIKTELQEYYDLVSQMQKSTLEPKTYWDEDISKGWERYKGSIKTSKNLDPEQNIAFTYNSLRSNINKGDERALNALKSQIISYWQNATEMPSVDKLLSNTKVDLETNKGYRSQYAIPKKYQEIEKAIIEEIIAINTNNQAYEEEQAAIRKNNEMLEQKAAMIKESILELGKGVNYTEGKNGLGVLSQIDAKRQILNENLLPTSQGVLSGNVPELKPLESTLEQICNILGIEIPLAAEKSEQAINEIGKSNITSHTEVIAETKAEADAHEANADAINQEAVAQEKLLDAKKEVNSVPDDNADAAKKDASITEQEADAHRDNANAMQEEADAQKKLNEQKSRPDDDTSAKIQALNTLEEKLKAVTEAVNNKTKAFQNEGTAVKEVVSKETEALEVLAKYIDTIGANINSIIEGLSKIDNAKLNDSDVKTDSSTPSGSDSGYALDSTVKRTNEILGGIKDALSGENDMSKLAESLKSVVDELKNVANGIADEQNRQKNADKAISRIDTPEKRAQLSDIVIQAVSPDNLDNVRISNNFRQNEDGTVDIGYALKNAEGVWEGYIAKVNESNEVIKMSVNRHSLYAKELNEVATASAKAAAETGGKSAIDMARAYQANRGALSEKQVEHFANQMINRVLANAFGQDIDGIERDNEGKLYFSKALSGGNTPENIAEMRKEYELYDQILQQIGYHLEAWEETEDVPGFSAKVVKNSETVVNNLEEARNILLGINQQTEKATEASNITGKGPNITAAQKKKYDVLTNAADPYVSAGSVKVDAALQNYKTAYQELKNAKEAVAKADDGNIEDAIRKFNIASDACNRYAKELEDLIKQSSKFDSTHSNIIPVKRDTYNLDDLEESKQALIDYVNTTYEGKAKIKEFDESVKQLHFTMKDADGSIRDMHAAFDATGTAIGTAVGKIRKEGSLLSNVFNGLGKEATKLFRYFAARFGIEEVFQAFRTGVQYVRDIDRALTELKKVTSETDATYQNFLQTMSQVGSVIGATTADLTNSAADWARLGWI